MASKREVGTDGLFVCIIVEMTVVFLLVWVTFNPSIVYHTGTKDWKALTITYGQDSP